MKKLYSINLFIYKYYIYIYFIVSGETSGGDAAALSSQLGRGAMRGRRMIPSTPENIQTRPENLITKQG